MLAMQTVPNPIPSIPAKPALPVLTKRAKDFITTRLERREPPERIAVALRAYFEIDLDPVQVIPYWKGELTPPTQTGHRQEDKESVQIPADAEKEPLFTRVMPDERPATISDGAKPEAAVFHLTSEAAAPEAAEDAPTTQTGRRQNEDSLQLPADTVDEPNAAYLASDKALETLGALVKANLGLAPEPAPATQTGRRQNERTPSILTDEVKAFIVRGLARYETPTRVAASVQAQFGIAIDRRQVFAYDPAGSRRPAQRWINLHTATRAKFMRATAEIGIAQKVVRLRMLDRFANRADDANQMERAAAFLVQAAKECGGFYERFQRPKAAADAPQDAPPVAPLQ